jgi:hypothetical protein
MTPAIDKLLFTAAWAFIDQAERLRFVGYACHQQNGLSMKKPRPPTCISVANLAFNRGDFATPCGTA